MIFLLEKWMPPFVSLLFYRKRKRERHSNTARYLHCGMVIYKYMRYILRWKFIEHKEVPEMLTTSQDRRLLLKTNNTNPDLCAVVSCYVQAVENARARILQHLGRRLPIIPRTSLDWKATGEESATSPGTYSLRFFEDLKTCCSYQWFTGTDVSWCRVYLRHFYLFIALRQNQFALLEIFGVVN